MARRKGYTAAIDVEFGQDERLDGMTAAGRLTYLYYILTAVKHRREWLPWRISKPRRIAKTNSGNVSATETALETLRKRGLLEVHGEGDDRVVRVCNVREFHAFFRDWNDADDAHYTTLFRPVIAPSLSSSVLSSQNEYNRPPQDEVPDLADLVVPVIQDTPEVREMIAEDLAQPEPDKVAQTGPMEPRMENTEGTEPKPESNNGNGSWVVQMFVQARGKEPTPHQEVRLLRFLNRYGMDPKIWKEAFDAWGDADVPDIRYLEGCLKKITGRKVQEGKSTTYELPDPGPRDPELVSNTIAKIREDLEKRKGK